MRFKGFILALVSLLIFVSGCEMINPTEKIPSYIHIDSFSFAHTPNTGTQSHNIPSIWVYLDNAPIGLFDLPATIPILSDKGGSLTFRPGIFYSGLSDVVVPYPFYQRDTADFDPNPGQVVNINPVTRYYPDSILSMTTEDFESGNSFVQVSGDTLEKSNNPEYVFEGNYGGVIRLNNTQDAENIMSQPFTTVNNSEVYLELNYKGNVSFQVGMQFSEGASDVKSYLFGFRPRAEWTKVYVALQDFIYAYPNKTYRILIKVSELSPSNGYIAFDNFKIVAGK